MVPGACRTAAPGLGGPAAAALLLLAHRTMLLLAPPAATCCVLASLACLAVAATPTGVNTHSCAMQAAVELLAHNSEESMWVKLGGCHLADGKLKKVGGAAGGGGHSCVLLRAWCRLGVSSLKLTEGKLSRAWSGSSAAAVLRRPRCVQLPRCSRTRACATGQLPVSRKICAGCRRPTPPRTLATWQQALLTLLPPLSCARRCGPTRLSFRSTSPPTTLRTRVSGRAATFFFIYFKGRCWLVLPGVLLPAWWGSKRATGALSVLAMLGRNTRDYNSSMGRAPAAHAAAAVGWERATRF